MKILTKLSLALQQKFRQQALHRKREMDLVMLDREQVDQYNKNGIDGGLAVLYDFIVNTLLKYSPIQGQSLDICCGPAHLLLRSAQAMPQMNFTGLDMSPHMLHFAEENRNQLSLRNVNFKLGNMYELEKTFIHKFDLITWCDAMHHCENEDDVVRVLNQVARMLNPGGCFFIFDFVRPKTGRLALELSNLYARDFGDWIFQDNLDSYKAAFTFEEVEEILRSSDLKNWRHIQPVIGNAFQIIMVASENRKNVKTVTHLKHFWQKMDYEFLKMIFAGRV